MRHSLGLLIALWLASGFALIRSAAAADPPLVEKYLLDGQLAEGAEALQARLQEDARDDQSRFGLGVIQFLQTFEHLGGSLHKYGLRTEKSFLRPPPQVKEFLPQNANPEVLSYAGARQIVQTFVDDLEQVEATLAAVKDPQVKLPLPVGRIKIDPFGQGKPISAAFLFGRIERVPPEAAQQAEALVIAFDRGDVNWLRGYCHFLAAIGELTLAVDGKEAFERCAHLFFEKVETPHTFLLEGRQPFDADTLANRALLADAITFLHQMLRLEWEEPERTKAALAHLEAGIGQGQEMWKFILAESDNDQEWIPNPKQQSVVGAPVTQAMVDVWLETLSETGSILKGEKLIPFWRGKEGRGVNLRRVFTEPRPFDPIEWMQGTAATPYLEEGPLTKFTDPEMNRRLNEAFGGPFSIVGYGFWFN